MMGYGGNSLLWLAVLAAMVVIPFWKILPRYKIAPAFALLAILPVGAVILLWVIAFRDDLDKPGA